MPTDSPQQLKQILTDQVRTIALVGASDKPDRDSYRVMAFLQGHGYRVIPVNPRLAGQTLGGEPVHASLDDISEPVDMVDVFLNPDHIDPVVDAAIARSVGVLWLQLGVINEAAAARAEQAGLTVVMDHCPAQEIPRLGVPKVS